MGEFLSKETELHVLLNNAGCMALPAVQTKDGFDIQWGTNHMGHALLTKLLLPTLLRTAAATAATTGAVRIVNVSSEAHRTAVFGINLEDPAPARSNTWLRYGQSKLANILHAKALAKRYAAHGVIAVSCHPGVIHTDLYKPFVASLGTVATLLSFPLKYIFTSPHTGAHNQIAMCTSPTVTLNDSGAYYLPVLRKSEPSKHALGDALVDGLWEYTEARLKEKGY